jgi:hypothetical protein
MSEAVQRLEATKNDVQIQAIIQDPEFQRKLQADNKIALMRDPQILELAELIFASKTKTAEYILP